jgi:hypothetical protein
MTNSLLLGGGAALGVLGAAYIVAKQRRDAAYIARLPKLTWMNVNLAVVRLPGDAPQPPVPRGTFTSLTRTENETSLVCEEQAAPQPSPTCQVEKGWVIFRLEGPLDFALIGILSRIASVLADKKISIFAISTYDTDYVLVKSEFKAEATATLQAAGYVFTP